MVEKNKRFRENASAADATGARSISISSKFRAENHPSPVNIQAEELSDESFAKERAVFVKDLAALNNAFKGASRDAANAATRENWRKAVIGGTKHESYIVRAILKNAKEKDKIFRDILKDRAEDILLLANDEFLDKAMEIRLKTISAPDLVAILARSQRLGYDEDDVVGEDEAVEPASAVSAPIVHEFALQNQPIYGGPPPQHQPPVPTPQHPGPPQGQSYQIQPTAPVNTSPKFQCSLCNKCFTQAGGLTYHTLNKVCQKRLTSPGEISDSSKIKANCPKCNKGFTTTASLSTHLSNNVCGRHEIAPATAQDYTGPRSAAPPYWGNTYAPYNPAQNIAPYPPGYGPPPPQQLSQYPPPAGQRPVVVPHPGNGFMCGPGNPSLANQPQNGEPWRVQQGGFQMQGPHGQSQQLPPVGRPPMQSPRPSSNESVPRLPQQNLAQIQTVNPPPPSMTAPHSDKVSTKLHAPPGRLPTSSLPNGPDTPIILDDEPPTSNQQRQEQRLPITILQQQTDRVHRSPYGPVSELKTAPAPAQSSEYVFRQPPGASSQSTTDGPQPTNGVFKANSTPSQPAKSTTTTPASDQRVMPEDLPADKRAAMEEELADENRKLEAKIATLDKSDADFEENAQRFRLTSATRLSNIRKSYGVRLRIRGPNRSTLQRYAAGSPSITRSDSKKPKARLSQGLQDSMTNAAPGSSSEAKRRKMNGSEGRGSRQSSTAAEQFDITGSDSRRSSLDLDPEEPYGDNRGRQIAEKNKHQSPHPHTNNAISRVQREPRSTRTRGAPATIPFTAVNKAGTPIVAATGNQRARYGKAIKVDSASESEDDSSSDDSNEDILARTDGPVYVSGRNGISTATG